MAFGLVGAMLNPNQTASAIQSDGWSAGDFTTGFVGDMRKSFSDFTESVTRKAVAATRFIQTRWSTAGIKALRTIAEFQHAPAQMVEYVMANPIVRDLYHHNGCDGYSHIYQDVYPDAIGINHPTYQSVMDGVVTVREDDIAYTNFYDSRKREELTISDKSRVIQTWENLEKLLQRIDDPTDRFNNSL